MIALADNTIAGREVTLGTIETNCQRYDVAASTLDEMITALEADLDAVKQKHLRQLKAQAGIVAACEAALRSAVENTPGLFQKPRTFILHGVKVGLTQSKGKLAWDMDDDELVALLKRKFKADDLWQSYVIEKHSPSKEALRLLDEATLAKIGCRIEGAGDMVVLKRTAGDVEKMMEKLIEKMVGTMVGAEE